MQVRNTCCRGQIANCFKRQHIVFICYIPLSLTALESAQYMNKLTDAISEARSKFPDSWVTVEGDWNNRSLEPILKIFPDLAVVQSGSTRKDGVLDMVICNYSQEILTTTVNSALESDTGQISDHSILDIRSLLPRPKACVWEIHESPHN